jgi:glycosyltransferase involved in cell wall biosynthesis
MVIPSRAESLPYVILEAAAAGVPIISTRVGGVPEIFGPQNDQLIPPDDISALINAISAALDDPAGLKRVAQLVKARRPSSRCPPWSMAGLPPIGKRLRYENSRNSHNQIFPFVY